MLNMPSKQTVRPLLNYVRGGSAWHYAVHQRSPSCCRPLCLSGCRFLPRPAVPLVVVPVIGLSPPVYDSRAQHVAAARNRPEHTKAHEREQAHVFSELRPKRAAAAAAHAKPR